MTKHNMHTATQPPASRKRQPGAFEFLRQTAACREALATHDVGPDLGGDPNELSAAISRMVEGLVFLRLCEDRGLEPAGQLRSLQCAGDIHRRLIEFLQHVDTRYCGGRRHFAPALNHGPLQLDDAPLRQMLIALRPAGEACAVAGLPAALLGQAYEQSLAAAVPTRNGSCARGSRRCAARKASGAYYTPTALVEHIVQHTVGRPSGDGVWTLRIVDPACGCGAFLVRAYQHLLNQCEHGNHTLPARQRVLLDKIFGVDIDPRAVETTRLTLLLELFAGQPAERRYEGPLPDLTHNIRCGNALVAPDFDHRPSGGKDSHSPTQTLDWAAAFPRIFAGDNPGFDAVIGNPPWGQKQIKKDARLIAYLRAKFPSARGIFDLFRPFVEQAVRLCRDGGTIGLVLPDIVLLKNYAATRRYLLENLTLNALDWWGMRFPAAVIDTATIVGIKQPAPSRHVVQVAIHARNGERSPCRPSRKRQSGTSQIPQADFWANDRHTFNLFLTPEKRQMLQKLQRFPKLGDVFEAHEGVHSGNIRAELFVDRPVDDSCRPLLFGRDEIVPHQLRWGGRYIRLNAAPSRRTRERYAHVGRPAWFLREKLLVRRTGDRVAAAVDEQGRYASNNFFVVFPRRANWLTLYGLCALLNSPFTTGFFRTIEPRQGRAFAELKIKHLAVFPLPDPEREDKNCRALNELGRQRAEIACNLGNAIGPGEVSGLEAARAGLDARIAAVVARLFDGAGCLAT